MPHAHVVLIWRPSSKSNSLRNLNKFLQITEYLKSLTFESIKSNVTVSDLGPTMN